MKDFEFSTNKILQGIPRFFSTVKTKTDTDRLEIIKNYKLPK